MTQPTNSPLLIITGASKGIGKSTAKLFLAHGWCVINLSRTPCAIPKVTNYQVDLTLDAALSPYVADLIARIRHADKICLVHNAAMYIKDSINQQDKASLRAMLEVNIIAPSQLNQLVLEYMPPSSSILYIGSTLAEKAVKHAASYITCKHALVGMMRATCQDLAGKGIHTCCICPGFTDTKMLRSHTAHDPHLLTKLAEQVTAQRLIQPLEIAQVIYFCAMNPVINGSLIHANLGQIEH